MSYMNLGKIDRLCSTGGFFALGAGMHCRGLLCMEYETFLLLFFDCLQSQNPLLCFLFPLTIISPYF